MMCLYKWINPIRKYAINTNGFFFLYIFMIYLRFPLLFCFSKLYCDTSLLHTLHFCISLSFCVPLSPPYFLFYFQIQKWGQIIELIIRLGVCRIIRKCRNSAQQNQIDYEFLNQHTNHRL